VKDDNCVDKEYEEANEQGIATRRWGCIFCWLMRTILHNGFGKPCYYAYCIAIKDHNQH
jgi:hypothetical protein